MAILPTIAVAERVCVCHAPSDVAARTSNFASFEAPRAATYCRVAANSCPSRVLPTAIPLHTFMVIQPAPPKN
jgi:hypothetical protein